MAYSTINDLTTITPTQALATARGNKNGVFSLEDLAALGKGGETASAEWMKGAAPDPNALIRGGGRSVVPTGLPAGYYQIPGIDGAYYYDPHSGQVSSEFAAWANAPGGIARDPFTQVPKALMDSRDAGEVFRSGLDQQAPTLDTLNKIISMGRGADGTYQDSQDRVLGLGGYQQFVIGKDGKKIPIADVNKSIAAANAPGYEAPPPVFQDLSAPQEGAFDSLLKMTGKTQADLDKTIGLNDNGYKDPNADFQAAYWKKMENALAANYTTNVSQWQGLQKNRAALGLDVNTGISKEETKRIYDTYNNIQDPAEKAAYIKQQDPGNLTPELRQARYDARGGERELITADQAAHPEVQYESAARFGAPSGPSYNQAKVTIGSKTFTDTNTGRDVFAGNVPVAAEAVKRSSGDFDKAMHIVGGGVMGALTGFATGGIPGAFLGAYTGAGGPMPNGKGKFVSSGPHMMSIGEVGTAMAFARITGSGMYGKGFVGSAPTQSTGARAFMFAKAY